jgi:SAM-dependent methyltransferase
MVWMAFMIRWITLADFQDLFLHIRWTSFKVVLRALNLTGQSRTLSRWNSASNLVINWYDVPYIVEHVQKNMTGNGKTSYASYLMDRYFQGRNNLRVLSPGCGIGVKEFQFAKLKQVGHIDAFDIAPIRIEEAKRRAAMMELHNVHFFVGNIYDLKIEERYDIVLFDGCLHHFDGLDGLMDRVKSYLKPDGLLVILEFTGPTRYQFEPDHVRACNEALKLIPRSHRTFLQSALVKNKIWAPGYIRMYLSDPSEGVQSGEILTTIHQKFEILEEKKVGGDILAPVLKGTVHHYMQNADSNPILDRLFEFEKIYLDKKPTANYTFGVYKPKFDKIRTTSPVLISEQKSIP